MKIRQVAKTLRLSVATVSRTLDPATEKLVADKTRRRVRQFVARIGYVPNRSARALSMGKTHTIGLVLPNVLESIFFNDYLSKILTGVHRVLDENPPYTCTIVILPQGRLIENIEQQVLESDIDGLLLSTYCDPALYGTTLPSVILNRWKKPLVFLNQGGGLARKNSCVYFDNYEAARQAVTYLIQKGHKKIAMIQGDERFSETHLRFSGYQDVLNEHGLKEKKEWLAKGDFLNERGYKAALEFIKGKAAKPTAIFCANDEMAIGAIRALKTLKVKIPRDVAVMGFDGINLGSYVDPPLTSLLQPTSQIAEEATRLLLSFMEYRLRPPVFRAIPTKILVRGSA